MINEISTFFRFFSLLIIILTVDILYFSMKNQIESKFSI